MKIFHVLWLALVLGTTAVGQNVKLRNFNAEMALDAEVQESFFQRFPDLADEKDLVSQAAREVAAEGGDRRGEAEAAERLAARTRSLLARRTPQEWQRKAVSLFPELGVAGSEFNKLFLDHFRELQKSSPAFMEEPSWPVLLAKRSDDELRKRALAKAPASAQTSVISGQGEAANRSPVPAPTAARTNKWLSAFSFFVLLALVAWPAVWLWRCSRAFAGDEASRVVWQRALRPAAWTFLVFGLFAQTRTFLANADLGFLDRFGITLIVSLLAGAVFAVPAYGIALAFGIWHRRRGAVSGGGETKAKA